MLCLINPASLATSAIRSGHPLQLMYYPRYLLFFNICRCENSTLPRVTRRVRLNFQSPERALHKNLVRLCDTGHQSLLCVSSCNSPAIPLQFPTTSSTSLDNATAQTESRPQTQTNQSDTIRYLGYRRNSGSKFRYRM